MTERTYTYEELQEKADELGRKIYKQHKDEFVEILKEFKKISTDDQDMNMSLASDLAQRVDIMMQYDLYCLWSYKVRDVDE